MTVGYPQARSGRLFKPENWNVDTPEHGVNKEVNKEGGDAEGREDLQRKKDEVRMKRDDEDKEGQRSKG